MSGPESTGLNKSALRRPDAFEREHGPASTAGRAPQEEATTHEADESERTFGMKLLEHITGHTFEDPALVDRLIEDKQHIRAKYRLPSEELAIFVPSEYEEQLRALAQSIGTKIRPTGEQEAFFKAHPIASGMSDNVERYVFLDVLRDGNRQEYVRSLGVLEHELIHQLQSLHTPGMPIELQEYEAYLAANLHDLEYLRYDPNKVQALDFIFSNLVGGSVRHWYAEESGRRGEAVQPSWE